MVDTVDGVPEFLPVVVVVVWFEDVGGELFAYDVVSVEEIVCSCGQLVVSGDVGGADLVGSLFD